MAFEGVREFLQSKAGRWVALGAVGVGLGAGAFSLVSNVGATDAVANARQRVLVDASTGKTFTYELQPGDVFPVRAPSGQQTGFPAESCYWTKDGQVKPEPTYVLLNRHRNQPGPTFCPDCGRLVTENNPGPMPGQAPPPTKAEFEKR